MDTAALSAGWHLIEIAYRLPAGDHTLTMTGDGDPVAVDLLIIDVA